jgi:hypothetical protein
VAYENTVVHHLIKSKARYMHFLHDPNEFDLKWRKKYCPKLTLVISFFFFFASIMNHRYFWIIRKRVKNISKDEHKM